MAQHGRVDTRAEVVDVADQQVLAAAGAEAGQQSRGAERRREVAVPGPVRGDLAVGGLEQVAVGGQAHRDELREVLDLARRRAEVGVLGEMPFGRLVGREAVHAVELDPTAAGLAGAQHVFDAEPEERARRPEHRHDALDDAAEAGRHAAVEHDDAQLAARDRRRAQGLELAICLRVARRQLLDRAGWRCQQVAGHGVGLLRQLASREVGAPTLQKLGVEAVPTEEGELLRVEFAHGGERVAQTRGCREGFRAWAGGDGVGASAPTR